MTELRNVIHLYIGCEMILEKSGRIATLKGVSYNRGELSIHDGEDWRFYKYFPFKPILRPLSDITKEEKEEVLSLTRKSKFETLGLIPIGAGLPEVTALLLSRGFDLFNLIENGTAIKK